jgi:hypothetical protein
MTLVLLEQISAFENLVRAFAECARGKRASVGYQRAMFAHGERLLTLQNKLRLGTYVWQPYREIIVKDPKKRLVMAAPFMDRVVHTAIHRVIEPIFETHLLPSVYACRRGRGNRLAAQHLLAVLQRIGPKRFVVKLDVRRYFDSIAHKLLLEKVCAILPDRSLDLLFDSLLRSHPLYANRGYGIPIGNLSSQLFANFYLTEADAIATAGLGDDGFYFRYMDDMVLGGPDKQRVLDVADQVVGFVTNQLRLTIPFTKRMPLGNAPVPFLGYLLDHTGYRILARNGRRHSNRINRLKKLGARPSQLALRELSFAAFARLV